MVYSFDIEIILKIISAGKSLLIIVKKPNFGAI